MSADYSNESYLKDLLNVYIPCMIRDIEEIKTMLDKGELRRAVYRMGQISQYIDNVKKEYDYLQWGKLGSFI